MIRILNEINEFGIETDRCSALARGFEQDRFEKILRQVADANWARQIIIGLA